MKLHDLKMGECFYYKRMKFIVGDFKPGWIRCTRLHGVEDDEIDCDDEHWIGGPGSTSPFDPTTEVHLLNDY